MSVAEQLGAELSDAFSAEIEAEVARHLASPGLDDPALVDFTSLPFVTIDGPNTRDLDQAVWAAATAGGFALRYAIADASYYVEPGSALHGEALRRGASFYLPGRSIPMLPRALSEGLVSLNPEVTRRALVFDIQLDGRGSVRDFTLVRGRICSRAKLTFEAVDAFVAGRARVPGPREIAPSLLAIAAIGELRAKHEDRAAMVRYQRAEIAVRVAADGRVIVDRAPRTAIELANEQISILCNALGARFLQSGPGELVQPIYRIHDPPDPERVASFERLVGSVARTRGLPDDPWLYRRAADQGIAGYLQHLPTSGPGARLARALHRQAMLLNGRSRFDAEPRAHFGVGEQVYSRFTAPMREIVGVHCHAQAIDRILGWSPRSRTDDEALRRAVIDAGNRAKDRQRMIDREIEARAVAAVLGNDLAEPATRRPRRTGTVVGFASGRIHVVLDDPPIDVRVPLAEQGKREGGWLEIIDDGARLVCKAAAAASSTPDIVCRLGDAVRVTAITAEAVVIDAVELTLSELHDAIADRASDALVGWLGRLRARQPVAAIALVTDPNGSAIAPAATPLSAPWEVSTWQLDRSAGEFASLARLIGAQSAIHSGTDRFADYLAAVHDGLMSALEDADTRGAFDGPTGATPIARLVSIEGGGPSARLLEQQSAERLNRHGEAAGLVSGRR